MPVYKSNVKRDKGYSFDNGKLKLGKEEQNYGPQNDPNASPIDKAGLVDPQREKKAQQGWKLENEDGTTTEVQGPQNQAEHNPLDYADDPKATQQYLKDQGVDIAVDGKWGPNSMKKLNDYYNANPDVEPPFATELDNVFNDLGIEQKSYVGKTNYHINGKPVDYKRGEVSSGGEVSPVLVESVKTELPALKEAIPGLRITGGNDAYHHSDEYYARRTKRHRTRKNDPKFKGMSTLEAAKWGRKNLKPSGHTDGKSMDFATSDPEAARQAMMDNGFKKVKSGGHIYYKKGNITVIDEYAGKTSGGSGGHFHWGVKGSHKGHKH